MQSKRYVRVDPFGLRQLDPSGIALFWPRHRARDRGVLCRFEVCEDPSCRAREIIVWCIWVSDGVCAVELGEGRQVTVCEPPSAAAFKRRRGQRSPELYAVIDLEDWSVEPHRFRFFDPRASRLLDKLRAELDEELRAYLLRTFEEGRRRVAQQAEAARSRGKGSRVNVVPLLTTRGQSN